MKHAFCSVLMALAGLGSGSAAAQSFCTPLEQVVFSCSTGKKMVSVCASKPLTAKAGYMQYRFGPPGGPLEMTLPEDRPHPNRVATANTLMFSGGGGAYMRFSKPPYAYVVYSGVGRGWDKAGIAVEKDGKRIASLRCAGKVTSELGPDLFQSAGIPEDRKDFEIP